MQNKGYNFSLATVATRLNDTATLPQGDPIQYLNKALVTIQTPTFTKAQKHFAAFLHQKLQLNSKCSELCTSRFNVEGSVYCLLLWCFVLQTLFRKEYPAAVKPGWSP